MKLTIAPDALRAALQSAGSVLSTKPVMAVLSNLLLVTEDNALRIVGTNIDLSVSLKIPASVEAPGQCTVPAKKLADLVKELGPDPVRLTLKGERLAVESGKTVMRFVTLPAVDFPALPTIDFSKSWMIGGDALKDLISRTGYAVATDEQRPSITGVFWTWENGIMRMVSTNGHRLAMGSMATPTADSGSMIVPPKALALLQRQMAGDQPVRVASNGTYIGFEQKDTFIASRLIEGSYPPYQKVIPADNTRTARFEDKDLLKQTLRRMDVIAHSQTHKITVKFEDGLARFAAETPDLGQVADELAVSVTGGEIVIGFNVSYLLEALDHIPTKAVEFSFKEAHTAAVIRPVLQDGTVDQSYMSLVMPLRLTD